MTKPLDKSLVEAVRPWIEENNGVLVSYAGTADGQEILHTIRFDVLDAKSMTDRICAKIAEVLTSRGVEVADTRIDGTKGVWKVYMRVKARR